MECLRVSFDCLYWQELISRTRFYTAFAVRIMEGAIDWAMRKLYGRDIKYTVDMKAYMVYFNDDKLSIRELFYLAGVFLDDGHSWCNGRGSYAFSFCPPK